MAVCVVLSRLMLVLIALFLLTKCVANELVMPEDDCVGDSSCFHSYLTDESFVSVTGSADSSDLLSKLVVRHSFYVTIVPSYPLSFCLLFRL